MEIAVMVKKDKKNKVQKLVQDGELQTNAAQITALRRVLSEHPASGLTPSKLKNILESAESGDIQAQHDLYRDIEEDSAIGSAMSTRKNAILTLEYTIEPPRNPTPAEEQLTTAADDLIRGIPGFNKVLLDMMDAVGHGFSPLEVTWELVDGRQLPVQFTHRPQSWFKWDKDDNLLLKTPTNEQGEALWPLGWVVHIHKMRSVQAAREGLFRLLAWMYMFKHYSSADFAEFLELYGIPIRIGKYEAGTSEKDKRTLLRALAQIGHNAAGIMPKDMEVEIINATASSGNNGNNPFIQMIDWCEKSISKLILGQTLTSGADGKASTNALGQIHNEVRRDLMIADAKRLEETITQQIILPYLQINFPNVDPRRIPSFAFDVQEPGDLTQLADALPKLVGVGMQIPEPWARKRLGIPDPQPGELLLSSGEQQAQLSARQGCSCCNPTRTAALSSNTQPEDKENRILDQVLNEALQNPDFNAQLNPMVQQAVAALMACNDYEEASTALVKLYPQLDNSQLQNYMQNALYLADLLGHAHG
jgi:phage gp29-like protein